MEWRNLTLYELNMLNRLLTADFKGKNEIEEQLEGALVKTIDSEGSITFKINSKIVVNVNTRVPVEAMAYDKDSIAIHALLHIHNGKIKELEFYKEDGSMIINMPEIINWEIIILD